MPFVPAASEENIDIVAHPEGAPGTLDYTVRLKRGAHRPALKHPEKSPLDVVSIIPNKQTPF